MNLHTIVLCSVLLLVAPLFGREKSDVIVMKNGDHLTCEIKGLSSGVLYVSLDYILGTSSVQWSKVDHLESSQLFIVKTESGMVYTGALSAAELLGDRPMKIEVIVSSETKVAIDRAQIVKMDQTSEKFWQRFNGDINLGVIYSKGNQSTQFSLNSTVQYPREHWSAQASGQLAVRRERNAPEIGSAAVLLDKRDGVGGTSPGRFQLRNDPRRNLATILVSQLHDGASR